MEVITIESKAFEELKNSINSINETLEKLNLENLEDIVLDSKQVQKVLGISQKTWQTYRDKRMIKFTQVGQKIYVKASWIEEFLDKNQNDSF